MLITKTNLVSDMNIAQRKEKILSAVVESYIATGEPVGSKTLQNNLDLSVSSATIRNELADLTASGFLSQPHTSAGRIPTQKGYRFYVDNLMTEKPVPEKQRVYIEQTLYRHADTPENILDTAAAVLSQLTNVAAIASSPPGNDARVHRISFVATGRHTAMLVLVTSTGMVKTKIFRCEFVITKKLLEVFENAFNEKLSGVPLEQITQPFIQTLAVSFGELSMFTTNVLVAVMESARLALETKISIHGQTKLLFLPEYDIIGARGVLSFLNDENEVARLILGKSVETSYYIGSESKNNLLQNSAVIVSRYKIANRLAGVVALVGSMKMDYSLLTGQLEFVSKIVGELISDLMNV